VVKGFINAFVRHRKSVAKGVVVGVSGVVRCCKLHVNFSSLSHPGIECVVAESESSPSQVVVLVIRVPESQEPLEPLLQ